MIIGKRRRRKTRRTRRLTRLGLFVRDSSIKPNELADVSGVSRQHLTRLRYGQAEPTRPVMIWLTIACRRLLEARDGRRIRVRVQQLFDLGDE